MYWSRIWSQPDANKKYYTFTIVSAWMCICRNVTTTTTTDGHCVIEWITLNRLAIVQRSNGSSLNFDQLVCDGWHLPVQWLSNHLVWCSHTNCLPPRHIGSSFFLYLWSSFHILVGRHQLSFFHFIMLFMLECCWPFFLFSQIFIVVHRIHTTIPDDRIEPPTWCTLPLLMYLVVCLFANVCLCELWVSECFWDGDCEPRVRSVHAT